MSLAKHIRRLITVYGYSETIIQSPSLVRRILLCYKVTPSLNQVKRAINKDVYYILYGKTPVARKTIFRCDCGNPTAHVTDACKQAMALERDGIMLPEYHCSICQTWGDSRYADSNGVVWVDGLPACEFNQRLIARTRHQDEQMRRDMTYAFA
jgi:hypothetical protein